MKVAYMLNNYQVGGKMRMTPTHKITYQKRVDKSHVEVIYELNSVKEKDFCDKVFAKKGKVVQ